MTEKAECPTGQCESVTSFIEQARDTLAAINGKLELFLPLPENVLALEKEIHGLQLGAKDVEIARLKERESDKDEFFKALRTLEKSTSRTYQALRTKVLVGGTLYGCAIFGVDYFLL